MTTNLIPQKTRKSQKIADTKITIFQVNSSKEKIEKLLFILLDYFSKKIAISIKTSNITSSEFVDKLLWNYTKYSFLPHSINSKTELISITEDMAPHNLANVLFNLSDTPIFPIPKGVGRIYELEDISKEQSKKQMQNKYHVYRELGCSIVSI